MIYDCSASSATPLSHHVSSPSFRTIRWTLLERLDPIFALKPSRLDSETPFTTLKKPEPHEIRFAITIPTWWRPNRESLKRVSISMGCLMQQTWAHWKVFMVGDDIKNQSDFGSLVKLLPPERISFFNLMNASERLDPTLSSTDKWSIGGAAALNKAIELARAEGYACNAHSANFFFYFFFFNGRISPVIA